MKNNSISYLYNLSILKYISTILSVLIVTFIFTSAVNASNANSFDIYMNMWNEKRTLASKYLKESEKFLRNGDELNACVSQRKAGQYGIEATKMLIKAMKINNPEEDITNLKTGLKKWQELKDFC